MKKLFKIIGAILIIFLVISVIGRDKEKVVKEELQPEVSVKDVEDNVDAPISSEKEKEEPVKSSKETLSQKNAIKGAKNYLSISPFSKSGLIKQLEFEGYSNEDATYAVDEINADWKEQAVKGAKNYLSISPFSKSGLIKQLEFEGYSNGDATYAADEINADWQEQAVKSAKNYLDITPFSRGGLIEQLKFEGYSNEDATYAVDKIGL